jgi:DNA-binding NarL/FixJ family response regulator
MKVLVADDFDLVRETIAAFLIAEGADRVDMAATLNDVIEMLGGTQYDVALVDYNLTGMGGLEGLARAVAASRGAAVALLSQSSSMELAAAAMDLGARGFVPKKMAARAMVAAVRLMARGDKFAPLGLLHPERPAGALHAALTMREATVLRGLCEGKSNKEIARDLALQEVTVKLHVKTLSRKLGARNRTHAAMIARSGGLA